MDFNKKELYDHLLNEIGTVLVRKARNNMDKVSVGRRYTIKGRKHIASKPYEAPNNFTGNLNTTIRYERITFDSIKFGAGDQRIKYAKFLEAGTQRMKPRPNYNKTIVDNIKNLNTIVEKAMKEKFRLIK